MVPTLLQEEALPKIAPHTLVLQHGLALAQAMPEQLMLALGAMVDEKAAKRSVIHRVTAANLDQRGATVRKRLCNSTCLTWF